MRSDVNPASEVVLQHFQWIDGHADTWRMLSDPGALQTIIDGLASLAECEQRPDLVIGVEARGLALGLAVAARLGIGFAPVRKSGALFAGDKLLQTTEPDYRGIRQELSIRRDLIAPGSRVVLIDDWIETGSQARAAMRLVARCGANLASIVAIVDDTNDNARNGLPSIHSLVTSDMLPSS